LAVGLEPGLHHLDFTFLGRDDPLRQFAQLRVLAVLSSTLGMSIAPW
jgi:hypothetical protein